jgi:hypothetical protein
MNDLSLAGTHLEHFHVCAFFNSRDEAYEVLNPFFNEGIQQGEKNLHILNPERVEEHRTRLAASGIDVPHCEACGQLEITPWLGAYLDENGVFDKDRMLSSVQSIIKESRDKGYSRIRIMGDMDWAFEHDVPGAADLLKYEAEVNEVLTHHRQPAVCVYDVAKLSGAMMMDLLRTHPLTLIGGVVQENPFYTPATEMLRELKQREVQQANPGKNA